MSRPASRIPSIGSGSAFPEISSVKLCGTEGVTVLIQ